MYVPKTYYQILKIGFNNSLINFFHDYSILLYIVIDVSIAFASIELSKQIFVNQENKIHLMMNIIGLLFLPLMTSSLNIIFYKTILKKKLFVVNNILNYIKKLISYAPNSFHDKYDINEKYKCFTTCIWGFDSVAEIVITLCSSTIKILILSINISIKCTEVGLLIIFFNLLLLYVIPKITKYMEKYKNKESNRKYYSSAYYSILLDEENRANPILSKIQYPNVNESLEIIVSRYWNMTNITNLTEFIRNVVKNLLLVLIFVIAYYKNNLNLITIVFLNKTTIFGFSDVYEEFKKTENYNKRNMEELNSMLEHLEKYYQSAEIITKLKLTNDLTSKQKISLLTIRNLNYAIESLDKKLIKRITSEKLIFNFTTNKHIVQISGKTGCGKSLFTKIISGQTDSHDYILENGVELLENFSQLINQRIVISQTVSEDYSYNSSIKLQINKLFPNANNFQEIYLFLEKFNIHHKLDSNTLDCYFQDKLSGGEHQRVALASLVWKVLKLNPSWIIIDEPEKGIDEETIIQIMDWFLSTYKGIVFLITHNQTIKSKYLPITQSIIKYRFSTSDEKESILYQEFL